LGDTDGVMVISRRRSARGPCEGWSPAIRFLRSSNPTGGIGVWWSACGSRFGA